MVRVSRQFMTGRGGIEVGPLMTLATPERRPKPPTRRLASALKSARVDTPPSP